VRLPHPECQNDLAQPKGSIGVASSGPPAQCALGVVAADEPDCLGCGSEEPLAGAGPRTSAAVYGNRMTDAAVRTVDSGARKVSRRVVVDAPAAQVFALVADSRRHLELDGSGTVRDSAVAGPDLLSAGAKFTVGMRAYGVPYKITSTVTAFDVDRTVEWQHPLGHRWRWELAAVEPGVTEVTEVTETFDYTTARSPRMLELFGYPKINGENITKTLRALAARFA
jgi:Polyketide cyclase / dehydrase and lipid transport